MKWIGRIIGIFCIFYGIYTFGFSTLTQAGISSILILMGISTMTTHAESQFWRKVQYYSARLAVIVGIIVVIANFILG